MKKHPARLAAPSPISSRRALMGYCSFSAIVLATAKDSRKPTMEMVSAGPMSWPSSDVRMPRGDGNPAGTLPMTLTPLSSKSAYLETRM